MVYARKKLMLNALNQATTAMNKPDPMFGINKTVVRSHKIKTRANALGALGDV